MELPEGLQLDITFEDLYFSGALQSYEQGQQLLQRLVERQGGLQWLDLHHLLVMWDTGDEIDEFEPTEPAAAADQAAEAYRLLIQAIVATHVFAVMTLEAHINRRAETLLSPCFRKRFDCLRLPTKWLFLPRFVGAEAFDPGRDPFQSFQMLVTTRNSIVHSKGTGNDRILPKKSAPLEAAESGLAGARASIDAARNIAADLAERIGDAPPAWVRSDGIEFFSIAIRERIGELSTRAESELEDELWRTLLSSEPIQALRDIDAPISPVDVLRYDTFGSLARQFGARWFRDQAENWRLTSKTGGRDFPPRTVIPMNLETGETGPSRKVSDDPFVDEYAELRANLCRILAGHAVDERTYLRARGGTKDRL